MFTAEMQIFTGQDLLQTGAVLGKNDPSDTFQFSFWIGISQLWDQ